MKKMFQLGAVFFCILMTQTIFAADYAASDNYATSSDNYGSGRVIEDSACPQEGPCGEAVECWCKCVRYKPCYYTTKRCVEECVPCKKKCCRYVDKYYEVQKCRYVPEYYCETKCCKVPEYYEVDDTKICKKWVCDRHCKYVPEYYWKHTCGNASGCSRPCPR